MATKWHTTRCIKCGGNLYLDNDPGRRIPLWKCLQCSKEYSNEELKREQEALEDKLRGRQI
ncbi:hypothetical protein [Dehalococcoides mccartyi]|jgi:hypothetical protein|uniref:hypothetical protein n=1 Tax=Dehalococcoides mccartyi TaxID=61435 RepID=UPI0012D8852E|nr:hypothetical protein [Dehalococcoides mccartyi]